MGKLQGVAANICIPHPCLSIWGTGGNVTQKKSWNVLNQWIQLVSASGGVDRAESEEIGCDGL